MKILFDESLPKRLSRDIKGHQVATVVNKGWAGKKNGDLLRLAEKEFDVFLTVDKNIKYQQNLHGYKIVVIVLYATSNSYDTLSPIIPKLIKLLNVGIKPGMVVTIK